jgi:hypothetical protein
MRKMDEEGEPVSWISSAGLEDQNSFCKEQHHGPRFLSEKRPCNPFSPAAMGRGKPSQVRGLLVACAALDGGAGATPRFDQQRSPPLAETARRQRRARRASARPSSARQIGTLWRALEFLCVISNGQAPMAQPDEEKIRTRAFRLWQEAGNPADDGPVSPKSQRHLTICFTIP